MAYSRFCLICFGLLLLVHGVARAQQTQPATLNGARPVIHAESFSTLQAAIDALPKEGGVVRIPPGEFVISEPLVVTGEDVHLEGSGTATHIHNANEDGLPALAIVPKKGFDSQASNPRVNRWRIQFSNLRLTGNEKSGHGVEAIWVNEVFLHGLTISEHGGDGVRLDNCYEDPRINDCLITYNKHVGLNLIGCHDIVVSGCHFEENNDAVHCVDSFNLCMTGNNLDDHLRHGVVIENTYGSVLSGNMIEECNGSAVILDRDCYGITVGSNVIAHNGQGVDLIDAHGCAISANTFTIMKESALRIGPGSGRIAVTGNNFSNSFIGNSEIKRASKDTKAGGVVIDNATDITFTGNIFSGLTEKAIAQSAGDSKRIVFVGNLLVDVDSDVTGYPGPMRQTNMSVTTGKQ